MTQLNSFEKKLGIQEDNYSFEEKNGEIIQIEVYDSEYYDLVVDGDKLIEALSCFTYLRNIEITLSQCVVNDVSKLENLKELEFFQIECASNIKDLSVFEKLKSIKSISISNAKITDLSPLQDLMELESLVFFNNEISSIDCLVNLKKLRVLNVAHNQIMDIDVLSNFLLLESLILDEINSTDFSVIRNLKKLNYLSVNNNKITNIDFLKESNSLKYLYFDDNQVTFCDAISGHTELVYLSFKNNQVCDVNCLLSLTEIIHLDVSNNPIKNFSPVFQLKKLNYLNANNVAVDDFAGFENLIDLRYLFLNGCSIQDLSFLIKNTNIITLSLSNNNISEVSDLFCLKNITNLILQNNKLSNVFPLHLFYDLYELDLRGNIFGGALYVKYLGYNGVNYNYETAFTFDSLRTLIGDQYLMNLEYDKALVFCYFDLPVRNQLVIYSKKFIETQSSDVYYLRYYFSKCSQAIRSIRNRGEEKIEDLIENIIEKITSLRIPEKNDFLNCIQNSNHYFVSIYKDFFEYYNENPSLLKNSEVLYLLGKNHRTRETLLQSYSIYKELKSRKDPFSFRLYKELRRYLDYNFAYIESERMEYNKYRSLLDNIDEVEIPYFDYMDFLSEKYNKNKYYKTSVEKQSHFDQIPQKVSFSERFEIMLTLFIVLGCVLGFLYVLYLVLMLEFA